MRNLRQQVNALVLSEALQNFKIKEVTARYSGSGDSGSIDEIRYYGLDDTALDLGVSDSPVAVPYSETLCRYLEIYESYWSEEQKKKAIPADFYKVIQTAKDSANVNETRNAFAAISRLVKENKHETTLTDLIHEILYEELAYRVGGWENNEGGDGEFSITLQEDEDKCLALTIDLEHTQYFTESETSSFSHSFDL